jgi:uncharacterized membrane protein (UPF0127 family)
MGKLLTLTLLFILTACQSESQSPLKSIKLKSPAGDTIRTRLVYTSQDMERGLSGVKSNEFADDEAMLFFYTWDSDKYFWMPDTYFDLDLFYLNAELKVIDIERKLTHHIGRENESQIPRARTVWARHVLEMKASSPIATKIKVGDQLEWISAMNLVETHKEIEKLTK